MWCELKKYSQPKLRVMFYSLRIFKTLNPGGSTSSSPKRIALRQGEKPGYIEVLQQRTGSLNIRLPQWLSSKESACSAGDIRDASSTPGSGRSLEEKMATTSVFLTVESHGQRSLVGYSP